MAELRTDRARQGRTGRPVLYVLIAALALCVVVALGLGVFSSTEPDQNIGGAANSGASTAPATPANSQTGTVAPSTPAPGTANSN
ncbi:hypothetical protein [Aureimonas sp. ME7]|uniref:hypothetical protein n=1 Tax=Aureimonas sp. ME7 TaxID=2744252 RepID=UPI0015F77C9C|nr:hypothetical protein [Aureimonas sp. ME7]